MDDAMKERLQQMDGMWKQGKDRQEGPPDGIYTLILQGCEIKTSASSNKLYISRVWCVADGDNEGEVFYDMISLESDRGPKQAARFVTTMGLEVPETAEGLGEAIEQITALAPTVSAQIKHSGDFVNVNIKEVLESAPASAAKPGKAAKVQPSTSKFAVGSDVEYDAEGGPATGKVIAFDGDDAHVQDEAGNVWAVPSSDLRAAVRPEISKAKPVKAVKPAASPSKPDEESVLLLALAQSYQIAEVTDQTSKEEVVSILSAYEWKEADMLPDEFVLLKKVGVTVIEKPKPATAKPAAKTSAKVKK